MTLAASGEAGAAIRDALNALRKTPAAAQLAALLYGDSLPDGLGAVSPMWLAGNAEAAFAFVSEKPRAGHKVRVRGEPASAGRTGASVVEILNDDMPFLVDSVMGELQARGLAVRQLLHPIFKTERDAAGRLEAVLGPGDQNWSDGRQESYIAIHLAKPLSETVQADLVGTLSAILDEVRAAVADWKPMLRLVEVAARRLEEAPANLPAGVLAEFVAFLRWLAAGNFTFLGAREYRLAGNGEASTLAPATAEGLGLLRDPEVHVPSRAAGHADTTPGSLPLLITKASVPARVHRRVYMDCVSVRTYRPLGDPDGEVRFVGLFTSQAYTTSPGEIPLLRHKVASVLKLSGHPVASHDGKALLNVLGTFPRDELFQIETEDLRQWGEGILDLETRPRVRVFARIDRFDRFVAVLVYAPRDRYTSDARERIGALLAEAYKGRVATFYPYFADGPLVRVQFVIARGEGATPHVDTAALEGRIADIVRTWDDRLVEAIAAQGPQSEALLAKYGAAFPAGYAATYPAERALGDIARIERLGPQLPVAIDFYREPGEPASRLHAAVYRFGGPISLSQRVPVLENLGFRAIDEQSFVLSPRFPDGPRAVTLHDMVLETADGAPIDSRRPPRAPRCLLPRRLRRRGRQRQLQPAGGLGGGRLALGGGTQGVCRLSAPARLAVRAPLHRRHAPPPRRRHARPTGAVPPQVRSRPQARRQRARGRRGTDPAPHRGRLGRRPEPGRGPHPAAGAEPDRGDGADEFLSEGNRPEPEGVRPRGSAVSVCPRRWRRRGLTPFTQGGRGRRSSRSAPILIRPPSPSNSTAAPSRPPRSRVRFARSGSTPPAWRASTCASHRSPAAASAGRTGRRTSAPRCWDSYAPSASRTP